MNKRRVGAKGEDEAVQYLEEEGLNVLERNYQTRGGEIDIVAEDADVLVFIEVKFRSSGRYGDALEAVDARKQLQIRRMAREYLYQRHPDKRRMRFDVIGITAGKLTWVKDAF